MVYRLLRRRDGSSRMPPHPFDIAAMASESAPSGGYSAVDCRREFHGVLQTTPAGRRVLGQILSRCRVCDRSYVPGDSLETARREGMRDIGLWLMDMLAEDRPDRPRSAEADAPAATPGEPE